MKKIQLNSNYLKMHDSIDEMPITKFQAYNRFLLIDAGIGGDIESIDQHYTRMLRYANKKDYDNLIKELTNYRQNLHYVIEHTSPEMMAFGALIHSVNNIEVGNLADEEIQSLLKELSRKGLTFGKVRGFINHVKKKLTPSFLFSLGKRKDRPKSSSFSDN